MWIAPPRRSRRRKPQSYNLPYFAESSQEGATI